MIVLQICVFIYVNKCIGMCQLFFSGFICGVGCPVGSYFSRVGVLRC